MSLVNITCKKCGESTKMDIGEMSKEEVIKALSHDRDGFHCFGHHVEFGNRIDYWNIDWNSIQDGSAPSEEDFLSKLKSENAEVYNTEEMREKYDIINFSYGMCTAKSKNTGVTVVFEYTESPNGKRYYIK